MGDKPISISRTIYLIVCLFSALEDVMNEKVPLRPGQDKVIEELCRDLASSGHQCKKTDSGH